MKTLLLKTAALAVFTCSLGCGSSSNAGGTDAGGASPTSICIFPEEVFTGYDGKNTFKAPIRAYAPNGGALTEVTWSLGTPAVAGLVPNADGTLMITAKQAGSTTITAKMGTLTASVPFEIVSYPATAHDVGDKRYHMVEGMSPACVTCHGGDAGAADHTPTQLDADDDKGIQRSFLEGVDPEGRPLKQANHKWEVTEEEKAGLLAYLRSLEPKGYPVVDPAHGLKCK